MINSTVQNAITYLSQYFSKLLTYEVLTQDEFIDEDELRGVLGDIFERLNIKNFTDNDFFTGSVMTIFKI